jgi:DNA polymerase III subunit beta
VKVVCARKELLDACVLAQEAIPSKSKDLKPVLSHFLLLADRPSVLRDTRHYGVLHIRSANLTVSLQLSVPILDTFAPGSLLVPADLLTSALRECTTETVSLTAANSTMVLEAGPRYTFPLPPLSEFFNLPSLPPRQPHLLASHLLLALQRTVFCVAQKEQRYAFQGVRLEMAVDPPSFLCVATDGRHLGCVTLPVEDPLPVAGIAPRPSLDLLVRVLRKVVPLWAEVPRVTLSLTPTYLMVSSPAFTFYTLLLEGTYPPWRRIVPQDLTHSLTLTSTRLAQALRQAAVTTSLDQRRVELTVAPGLLTLSSSGRGTSSLTMSVDYEGPEVTLLFNPDYPLEMLATLPKDTPLRMDFLDQDSQLRFTDLTSASAAQHFYLVSPLVAPAETLPPPPETTHYGTGY